jgi:hypothetical protein
MPLHLTREAAQALHLHCSIMDMPTTIASRQIQKEAPALRHLPNLSGFSAFAIDEIQSCP